MFWFELALYYLAQYMIVWMRIIQYNTVLYVPCGLFWVKEEIIQHHHTYFQILGMWIDRSTNSEEMG